MYFFNKFVVVIVLFVVFKGSVYSTYSSTKEYLEFKLKETKREIVKAYAEAKAAAAAIDVQIDDYTGSWTKLWGEAWRTSQPRLITFSDQMFIIDGEKILSVNFDFNIYNTHVVNKLSFPSSQEPVKFIKSFSYGKSLFLLICQIHACVNYQGSDISNLPNRQIIEYVDLLPADACFFERGKQIYLIISYGNFNYSTVPSKIYKWIGTSLNYTEEVLTPPVAAVATIHDYLSTIVLFALKPNEKNESNAKIGCSIYKLQDESGAKSVSFLPSEIQIKSIILYNYIEEEFILLKDSENSSGIFWWDGTALSRWINIPAVKSSSLVNVEYFNNETLLFVYNWDTLFVYKIMNGRYKYLKEFNLEYKPHVAEIAVSKTDDTIMLVLIQRNLDDTHMVEVWQLYLQHPKPEHSQLDKLWTCFKELKDFIQQRDEILKDLKEELLKTFSPEGSNNTEAPGQTSKPSHTDKEDDLLKIDEEEIEVSTLFEIEHEFKKLKRYMNRLSSKLKEANFGGDVTHFSSKVVIHGDAEFDELHIDNMNIEYWNDQKLELDKVLISEIEQNFTKPLEGKNIIIDNLEVPSLCGIKSDNWLRVNDTERINLCDLGLRNSSIYNDTLVIDNDVTLENLNAEKLDGENFKNFLSDVFIEEENQIIRGNVKYLPPLTVLNLTANIINNHSSNDLLTRHTQQNLTEFYIEKLEVQHLYVDKINDVPVAETAGTSQENDIKGKITLRNLILKDKLILNENVDFSFLRPTQVYNEVTIGGNVYMKNLELSPGATLLIDNKSYNIHDIMQNSWTKSTNQTIKHPITLMKGAVVDKLSYKYLNGYTEKDFLYVDSEEINGENITFTNFHFNNIINNDTGEVQKFIEESSDSVTFLKPVIFDHLFVEHLFTDKYNGIDVDFIMQPNDTLKFSGITEFEEIYVEDELIVEDLRMKYLNSEDTDIFSKALRVDQDLVINELIVDEMHAKNMYIKYLNDYDLEEVLLAQENMLKNPSNVSITIDGDLDIKDNLQVDIINGMKSSDYIDMLANMNPYDIIDTDNITNVHILNDLTVGTLNGHNITELFEGALSKTKNQYIPELNVKNLNTEIINNQNVSNLMLVDEPCVFYGNVTFDELHVEDSVFTKTLNGKNVDQIYEDLHVIPNRGSLKSMPVHGNVSWDKLSSKINSISYLMNNAILKNKDQIITASMTFEKPVYVESMHLEQNAEELDEIGEIIADTVMDNPNNHEPIVITGRKIFKKNLTIGDLEVTGNIDIKYVNGHDFSKVSSQIYRKDSNETIKDEITFLGKVEIGKLRTNYTIHNVSLDNLVIYDQIMPKKMHFKHLIRKNVTLHTLDGVVMDDFLRKRVDIRKDYEIFSDVLFEDRSYVSTINGIRPEDFVVNSDSETSTIIYGQKTFLSNLTVEGNIEAAIINNVNTSTVFKESVLNNVETEIYGDLVFEDGVEIHDNVNVSGRVNELEMEDIMESIAKLNLTQKSIDKEITDMKETIDKFYNQTSKLGTEGLYLEEDPTRNIQIPRVISMINVQMKSTVRLDLHTMESPNFCGLENNCTCRRQSVVKILPTGNYTIRQEQSNNVAFNFYDPNRLFGLSIITGAVSNSKHCIQESDEHEISKVYWMIHDENAEILLKDQIVQVEGFIADAQRFVINDKLYFILAIFYDKATKSHATQSLLYEFNLKTKEIVFLQSISTNGAKAIHIFSIDEIGIYALISCMKGKAETLLFRFNFVTRQFHLIQTFSTGGSKYITSVTRGDDVFIILSNSHIESLQIFVYNSTIDRFDDYQNLQFDSRVTSLNVFYAKDFGLSEAYVVTTTKSGWLYVYEYMFDEQFQQKMSHWFEGIQLVSPFRHMKENYLFVGMRSNSTIFKVIQSETL